MPRKKRLEKLSLAQLLVMFAGIHREAKLVPGGFEGHKLRLYVERGEIHLGGEGAYFDFKKAKCWFDFHYDHRSSDDIPTQLAEAAFKAFLIGPAKDRTFYLDFVNKQHAYGFCEGLVTQGSANMRVMLVYGRPIRGLSISTFWLTEWQVLVPQATPEGQYFKARLDLERALHDEKNGLRLSPQDLADVAFKAQQKVEL